MTQLNLSNFPHFWTKRPSALFSPFFSQWVRSAGTAALPSWTRGPRWSRRRPRRWWNWAIWSAKSPRSWNGRATLGWGVTGWSGNVELNYLGDVGLSWFDLFDLMNHCFGWLLYRLYTWGQFTLETDRVWGEVETSSIQPSLEGMYGEVNFNEMQNPIPTVGRRRENHPHFYHFGGPLYKWSKKSGDCEQIKVIKASWATLDDQHCNNQSEQFCGVQDCSNLHQLPNLKFNLDGQELELPPQAYVMRPGEVVPTSGFNGKHGKPRQGGGCFCRSWQHLGPPVLQAQDPSLSSSRVMGGTHRFQTAYVFFG